MTTLWARCGSCGWWGLNSDLIPDDGDDPHPCGKDECPECCAEGCICCCIPDVVKEAYENWDDEGDEMWPGFDEMEKRLLTFQSEYLQKPTHPSELELRACAYHVLTEEYDRALTRQRHEDGTADISGCRGVSFRNAKETAKLLGIRRMSDLNRPIAETYAHRIELLDHCCPDWRLRVRCGHRLSDVEGR